MQTNTSRGYADARAGDARARRATGRSPPTLALHRSSRPDQLKGLLQRNGLAPRYRRRGRQLAGGRELGSGPMAKKVVGLKLGASRLNAACVSVNGSAEVVQLRGARRLRLVDRRRRGARRRGARRRAQGLLREAQASEAQRPHRRREQPHRRPHDRGRRHRRPEAARERRALPRPGGAPDPDRRGGPRLPDPRGRSCSRRHPVQARPSRRRLSRPRSPPTSRPAGSPASASSASTSRPSRSCAL